MHLKSTSGELDWLAFCYAAGELDAAEIEQFEGRLAAEQPAREALARDNSSCRGCGSSAVSRCTDC